MVERVNQGEGSGPSNQMLYVKSILWASEARFVADIFSEDYAEQIGHTRRLLCCLICITPYKCRIIEQQ